MKTYYIQYNVGRAKYVLNINDGVTKNRDGSDFIGIEIFKNKKKLNDKINELESQGYKYR